MCVCVTKYVCVTMCVLLNRNLLIVMEYGTANVKVFTGYVTVKLFSFKSLHVYSIVTQYNKYC